MKPSLSVEEQVQLFVDRGLAVTDRGSCEAFLTAHNYYRFSGYARYFQRAPHLGDNDFLPDATFDEIRAIYAADNSLRNALVRSLGQVELLLRTHVARVIADRYHAYGGFLEESFYTEVGQGETTVESMTRDMERSRDRHILHYRAADTPGRRFAALPIWSAVEAWSFGTLSRVVERGASGDLSDAVATSMGVAKAGFPYRVRALVYLRNRCAHHGRLWNHSVIDAGPTPSNVRHKAKRIAGQFDPRSVTDVIASLDDILARGGAGDRLLPVLLEQHDPGSAFWQGVTHPQSPKDHQHPAG